VLKRTQQAPKRKTKQKYEFVKTLKYQNKNEIKICAQHLSNTDLFIILRNIAYKTDEE